MLPQIFNLSLARPSSPKDDVIIDRTSHWGNPFKASVYGREKCLELYKLYLWNQINSKAISLTELAALEDKNLWCWCYPKACHGQILLDAARWAKEQLNG